MTDAIKPSANRIELWQLRQRQAHPLEIKVRLSAERIRAWYEHYQGNVYVAFSGGKDSTVLLHLVRSLYPDVPAIFSDTGLEYPEIREFVKSVDNVIWLKPAMSFKAVIEKYGYPVISKEQAQYIREVRTSKSDRLRQIRTHGNKYGRGRVSAKWWPLVNAPFMVSEKCCDIIKKAPAREYEKLSGNHPIIGVMADESSKRVQDFLRFGCNAFDANRPISRPLGFWTESDIWEYLRRFNVPYSPIYDMGYRRTGCMFCMFGVHLENYPNRFQRMKETHPKQWDYCIHKLGLGDVLDYIGVEYEEPRQSRMFEEDGCDLSMKE